MKILKISMVALTLGLMSFTIVSNENKSVTKTEITSPIAWKSETIDVGQIPQGTPKLIKFEFKNTGTKAVIITNVHGSCGCTATDYTKTSIEPGKSAIVKATYNAVAVGAFTKTVTVTTSAEPTAKILTFKGTVLAKS
ncbi:DUF1573 domain-containing protein [Flavobacterium sp.]|uniref:DUF1573 domain-containing protein n=1 Tax=Flavobacterium sp. TaxID=239 RepID=UPI0037509D89